MHASLKNYRQSPRKVRLVANLIRGKNVSNALTTLSFLPKRAALPMRKLLESAVSNAKQSHNKDKESLIVKKISVDKGLTFKRIEYRARGSSNLIKKRTSRVSIELGSSEEKNGSVQEKLKETVTNKE